MSDSYNIDKILAIRIGYVEPLPSVKILIAAQIDQQVLIEDAYEESLAFAFKLLEKEDKDSIDRALEIQDNARDMYKECMSRVRSRMIRLVGYHERRTGALWDVPMPTAWRILNSPNSPF